MIRNWYNQIPYSALKTKRKITKYINWQQFTKDRRGKPNEQLFPRQVIIQLPKYAATHIIGEPKHKYGQQEPITIRKHNRSTALERSVLKYWLGGEGGVLKPVLRVPNLALSFSPKTILLLYGTTKHFEDAHQKRQDHRNDSFKLDNATVVFFLSSWLHYIYDVWLTHFTNQSVNSFMRPLYS